MSSLTNGIQILRCFTPLEPELRLAEISRRVGLSRSHTHELVATLVEEGLIRRSPGSAKYRLGLGLFELGKVALGDVNLRRVSPIMLALAQQTGETVFLGILDEFDVVSVFSVQSHQTLRVTRGNNARVPVHGSASGKVLLAWQPESEIERVIRHGLSARVDRTITDDNVFRRQLAQVRRVGYAVSDRELEELVRSVSAPIRNERGEVIAALTVAAPSQRVQLVQVPELAVQIVAAADELSHLLQTPLRRNEAPAMAV